VSDLPGHHRISNTAEGGRAVLINARYFILRVGISRKTVSSFLHTELRIKFDSKTYQGFVVMSFYDTGAIFLSLDLARYRTLSMIYRFFIPSLAMVLFALTGCATHPENRSIEKLMDRDVGALSSSLASQIMSEPYHGNAKIKAKVEGEIDRRVYWWLRYFSVRERELFKRNLDRGENYRPMVEQILVEQKLPRELYYLAMIESGYVNHATSATRAVGIWQFMRPTALNYGLEIKGSVDERRQPIASTEAAARYLSDLHTRFDSWYLAIAAFNAGPGRVNKAIRQGHSRDFWTLANGGFLPQETMEYIPKFLAATSIGNHLSHFGFTQAKMTNPWPQIASVTLHSGTTLKKIATLAQISQAEVIRLNPRLAHDLAQMRKSGLPIWLPKSSATVFQKSEHTVVAQSTL
jgi:hypothetical protein